MNQTAESTAYPAVIQAAFIVTDDGQEQCITEAMIAHACANLLAHCPAGAQAVAGQRPTGEPTVLGHIRLPLAPSC